MTAWDLDTIAERLQGAALDHTLWPDVLADLSQTVGGAGALLFSTETTMPGPAASPDLEEMVKDYVGEGWNERDERYRALPTIIKTGSSVDQDFTSPEEMQRSGYYQDFLARHGRRRWFAGLGFEADHHLWVLSVQRTVVRGPFEPDERDRLATLWRPLSDAATLSRQLSFARVLGIADGLELIAQPCVLLTDRGRVLAMNESAESLVGDMIDIIHRTLEFSDLGSQASFGALLTGALSETLVKPASPFGVVRNRAGRRLSIRMIGLRGLARFSFTGARVLLLLGEPQTQPFSTEALIQATHGLTAGETRLAMELCSGRSLAQAADRLGIAYETARSRVKMIYAKTDTNRQGQLVALLASLRPAR